MGSLRDQLDARGRARRGRARAACRRCGKGLITARVQAVLAERTQEEGKVGRYPTVATHSVGLCDDCALVAYDRMCVLMDELKTEMED